ncbi:murein L,D-transpeptidase family protein [Hyphomicrobium sp.]|uniref:L,D-transpeptidase family protein n=1 Tax=Hyphomicrobium sp. TaxID=82 RepID=UPI0025C0CE10|nr:murein L,D-transpeptidase family protein [Hyphomicrobium sp.]MCC7251316.1 murein L,D-transpeptidase [Hyphomicrobium sp.]
MSRPGGSLFFGLGLIATAVLLAASPATAQPTPSDATATERLERWRAARGGRLQTPLPGTPDTQKPLTRLATLDVGLGVPVMIRIFKAESELELWVKSGRVYVPFTTYPICYWSGTLGPKLREGDKQAPEGFYTITERQLHHGGRWPRSLNIGYPNVFDRVNGRTGSVILVHGGCDSSGCFAMTNAVNAELYDLVSAALRTGTHHVPVHVFPFRMTEANIAAHATGPWREFWDDLRQGYESFERTRLPPSISVCGRRYRVRDASPFVRDAEAVELCPQDRDMLPLQRERQEQAKATSGRKRVTAAAPSRPPCSMSRASCRKWLALRDRQAASRTVAGHSGKSTRQVR